MKRFKLIAAVVCVMTCAVLALSGCTSNSYTPPDKTPSVSDTALSKSGTLRVGVNTGSAPLAGQTSSSSRIVGIDVDVAAYLADQMGLKVEIVDVGTEAEEAVASGKVDMVLGIDAAESEAQFWRSSTYIQSGVALFGKTSENAIPTVDSKPTIAAQASSKSSWRVTNLYGDESLVVQTDLKAAFDAMSKGTARYVASDALIGTYVAYTNNIDAKVVTMLQDASGYCAGVSSKNTELQGAVTSAIDKLVSGGMMDVIETKWLGSPMSLANLSVVKAPTAKTATSSSASSSSASASASAASAAAEPAEQEGDSADEEAQDEGEGEGEEA